MIENSVAGVPPETVIAKLYPAFVPVSSCGSICPFPPEQVSALPRSASAAVNPILGQALAKFVSAVKRLCRLATADDSFATARDFMRFGIAIAATMRITPTTIKSSTRLKPFFLIFPPPPTLKNTQNPNSALTARTFLNQLRKGIRTCAGDLTASVVVRPGFLTSAIFEELT